MVILTKVGIQSFVAYRNRAGFHRTDEVLFYWQKDLTLLGEIPLGEIFPIRIRFCSVNLFDLPGEGNSGFFKKFS